LVQVVDDRLEPGTGKAGDAGDRPQAHPLAEQAADEGLAVVGHAARAVASVTHCRPYSGQRQP
jgi:hypothetical protein